MPAEPSQPSPLFSPVGHSSRPRRGIRWPVMVCTGALVATVAGFWPSFFSRLGEMDLGHLIHGFSATAWMALPLLQAELIRRGLVRQHRQVGRWALALAAVVFASGLSMVLAIFQRHRVEQEIRLLEFAFADLLLLALFALFVVRAIQCIRRRDMDGHVRYIVGSVLLPLQPALVRLFYYFIPGIDHFEQAFWASLIAMEVLLVILLAREMRKGRIRAPFAIALAAILVIHVFAAPVAKSPAFAGFANWAARL